MSKKDSRLGADPLEWIKDSRDDASLPASHQASKTAAEKPIKATYYIKKPELIKRLKQLGLDQDRDLSNLVTEAIEDLLKKYASEAV